jgi:ribonuclease VapC
MIVVDSSALMAVALSEARFEAIVDALAEASSLQMSAGTLAELEVLNGARGTLRNLRAQISALEIDIVPVDADFARLCGEAYALWGKGLHRANLNFGDCFAYALAKERDLPLLYVGDDFAQTDVRSALAELRE